MDMIFNYLPDVFSYQSLRHHNYENSWLGETTNQGELTQFLNTLSTLRHHSKLLRYSGHMVRSRTKVKLLNFLHSHTI